METDSEGNYITVVVQLQLAADGTWHVSVTGTDSLEVIPLVPVMLVVRLWRAAGTDLLRGTVRLHGSDHWAPIQSNHQLETLVRAWLSSGGSATGS
jgi:hypothetical protein